MNINDTLYNKVDTFGFDYSCYPYDIKAFLTGKHGFLERQKAAEKITEEILREHGKEELIGCLVELAKVETGIRELEPRARDHVVHALLTFVLGIFINETYVKENNGIPVNSFQWKLAGLLHDVGYPIEIGRNVMRPFENTLNRLRNKFGARRLIRIQIIPNQLCLLSNNIDSLDLIQNQLEKWGLEIDTHREYYLMIESGRICHGIISSLAVLNVIDAMYEKNNPGRLYESIVAPKSNLDWNQEFFNEDIVSACSAIFIHNLQLRCFKGTKINLQKAPLPFILVLSDSLQDWERPSLNNPHGFPANLYDIKVSKGNLHFYADIPPDNKNRIKESILNLLDVKNIIIH